MNILQNADDALHYLATTGRFQHPQLAGKAAQTVRTALAAEPEGSAQDAQVIKDLRAEVESLELDLNDAMTDKEGLAAQAQELKTTLKSERSAATRAANKAAAEIAELRKELEALNAS